MARDELFDAGACRHHMTLFTERRGGDLRHLHRRLPVRAAALTPASPRRRSLAARAPSPLRALSAARAVLRCASLLKAVFSFRKEVAVSFDAAQVSAALAARGLRLTRQRRAVLDAIAAAPSSLSPLQVYDAARERCPELGLTTVYRTLEVLAEIGALRRVHGPDHCESFVPAGAAHGHTVVCSGCGRVTEFTACDMRGIVDAAARARPATASPTTSCSSAASAPAARAATDDATAGGAA